jgi:methyl-accepting chemotaxis protein
MNLSKMHVKHQLVLGFGCILFLLVILGGSSIYILYDIKTRVDDIIEHRFLQFEYANTLILKQESESKFARGTLLLTDEAELAAQFEGIDKARKVSSEVFTKLADLMIMEEGRRAYAKLAVTRKKYDEALDKFVALAKNAAKKEDARQFLTANLRPAQLALENDMDEFKRFLQMRLDVFSAEAIDNISFGYGIIIVLALVGIVVGVAAALWITRLLLEKLGGEPAVAVEITRRIAKGDLSSRIQLQPGDRSSLLASIKKMQDDLLGIVSEVQQGVASALQGDFGHRTDLSGRHGFDKDICLALNTLNEQFLHKIGGNPDDAVQVASRIAAGDLSVRINVRDGDNSSLMAAMASMRHDLQTVIDEVQAVVGAVANGDFSTRMDEAGKQGYAKTLAELLNRLNQTALSGLSDISRVATALSDGDLTQRIDKQYPGLFGQAADGINSTRDKLSAMISEIIEAVHNIHSSASEIAGGNTDLSQRTEQQAASLEETASSMEQIAATVKNNAENARLANQLAQDTSTIALKGGSVIGEVVSTMSSIQQSSRKIVDIIGVIDGLAFQTNILALNAAVEAARAGEQGRGFAVVASEVRSLAQHSATAAKEIKQLISDSVETVENGGHQVEAAGQTMDGIVTAVGKTTDIMSEISAASSQQSAGIDQVNLAISQMDSVTQQNAALVEEAAASAESLEEQARQLQNLISVFRLQ